MAYKWKKQGPERTPANVAEASFFDWAAKNGWKATKRGWPDFFCVLPDRTIAAVEVKPTPHRGLKLTQRSIMEQLAHYGIRCYRYDPVTGLVPIKRD